MRLQRGATGTNQNAFFIISYLWGWNDESSVATNNRKSSNSNGDKKWSSASDIIINSSVCDWPFSNVKRGSRHTEGLTQKSEKKLIAQVIERLETFCF